MENPNQVSEAEGWHISYQIFIFTLEALARPPREACEAMGSYNPAWELRDDGMAGRYLLGSGRLSAGQEAGIQHLVDQLDAVPVDQMPGGAGLAPNLAAMRHPSWEPVRVSAAALLELLAPVTASSRAYLDSLGEAR